MDCPSCGGVLKAVKEKRVGRYREEKVEVTSELLRCGECGEGLFTPTQAKEHNRNVKDQVRRKHCECCHCRREQMKTQWEMFVRTFPQYVDTPENAGVLVDYLPRSVISGSENVTFAHLSAAFIKARGEGAFKSS